MQGLGLEKKLPFSAVFAEAQTFCSIKSARLVSDCGECAGEAYNNNAPEYRDRAPGLINRLRFGFLERE